MQTHRHPRSYSYAFGSLLCLAATSSCSDDSAGSVVTQPDGGAGTQSDSSSAVTPSSSAQPASSPGDSETSASVDGGQTSSLGSESRDGDAASYPETTSERASLPEQSTASSRSTASSETAGDTEASTNTDGASTLDGGSAATASNDAGTPSSNASETTLESTETETNAALPDAGPGQDGPRARLVVADPEEWVIYIYDVPSLELVGRYDGAHFAEHAGFLPLNDGRVLFADDQNYTLNIHDVFGPIPGDLRVIASLASPPVHFAVEPSQRFAAVSGMGSGGAADLFSLVDLADGDARYAPIPTGEPGVLLGGDPLLVYHRNDDPSGLEVYAFDALWAGQVLALDQVALGAAPHGEAMAHAQNKIFSATDEGLYVVDTLGSSFSEPRVIPYAASERTGGRAFYGRLGTNGNYLYSYLRNDGPSHELGWKDWTNDVYIVDVATETPSRVAIGEGLVYRFAESSRYAIFAQYHPDGDYAHFLDTDPTSPTFHTFVAKVPLPAMSKLPTGEDATPWDAEAFRLTAITPSGRYAFVTQGGDGEILVIETETMEVTGTITTPTPLNYGGYLLGMEEGAVSADTIGR